MSVTDIVTKKTAPPNEQFALEAAATTRLLEAEGILDYSGHGSIRIPGRFATSTAKSLRATGSRRARR